VGWKQGKFQKNSRSPIQTLKLVCFKLGNGYFSNGQWAGFKWAGWDPAPSGCTGMGAAAALAWAQRELDTK
jgi:hypothetical protein